VHPSRLEKVAAAARSPAPQWPPTSVTLLRKAGRKIAPALRKCAVRAGRIGDDAPIGNRVDIPLFPLVAREYTYYGSFWGNINDLTEVLALAAAGQIKHTVTRVRFDDVNDTLEAIARGEVLGRAVIVYD
jgi:D-arabinose 1-dehydrogenase-like Zn-dependent alcohol dehydrogenase